MDLESAFRITAIALPGSVDEFAKGLERDPQVESLLRGRTKELGMPPFVEGRVSQSLPNWIGWGRGRGLGR